MRSAGRSLPSILSPEFERFVTYKSNWKTTTFKKVCAGLGYRINSDREGNRWLKSVNGENKDFYQVVPQEGAFKGVLSTDAEEAAPTAAPLWWTTVAFQGSSVTTCRRTGDGKTDCSTPLPARQGGPEMTGMSRSFIYAQMAEGTFPKQIHLGARTIVWNEREVVQWMEDRMASR